MLEQNGICEWALCSAIHHDNDLNSASFSDAKEMASHPNSIAFTGI